MVSDGAIDMALLKLQMIILFALFPAVAYSQETKADRAIRAVKELCLVGKQFDLKVDAKGNLTMIKLTPGAEGSFSVSVRESAGAAAIVDDKIRQLADQVTQQCMAPHVGRIVDAILEEKPRVQAKPIEVSARSFVRGDHVAMASGEVSVYGSDVLMNAPPYSSGPNAAEFELRPVVGGSYRFAVRYAAAESRPLTLRLNGKLISERAVSAPTGCWEQSCQRWLEQGELALSEGLNIVRLETTNVFPHITALRFIPATQ